MANPETPQAISKANGDNDSPEPLNLREDFAVPSREEWRQIVERDLGGAPFDKKLVWRTDDGFDVQPIYTAEDLEGVGHLGNLPGFAPYVRGSQPLSGVRPPWQIRQDSMVAAPEDVNAAVRDGIARGQTAIGIRLDNAARKGLDGDSPMARDLAGRGGCTMSSINGMRIALADIDLVRHPITFRTGASALPVFAIYLALAEERALEKRLLCGGVECDPLRDFAKSGTLRAPIDALYREMADMVKYATDNCPAMRPVMVNSHPYHNAGASAAQELAFTLAVGTDYLRAMVARGIAPDVAAMSMVFSFSVGTTLFMEIAKLRAARMLWAKIAHALGAADDDAKKMFLHVRTSTYSKTVHDPYNNMIRTALESFAGAVGGCDSMFVAPFSESIGRPNDFAMRVARNQQILLQEECHLSRVVDPSAGSYYIESLTESLAREAWKLFQGLEAGGGAYESLLSGKTQKAVDEVAERRRKRVEQRRDAIVGVSTYANPDEQTLATKHIPRDEFLAERVRRLSRLKAVRKNSAVREALNAISTSVYSGEGSLMEHAVAAAKEGATIGEIMRALSDSVPGERPVIERLPATRASVPYEALRKRADIHREKKGKLPEVFLATMGPLVMRRARADFSMGFLGAGGFKCVEPPAFETPEDAADAAVESGCCLAVVCSDDPSYPDIVPKFIDAAKAKKPDLLVFVAGYPVDSAAMLEDAGVDGFIHLRANVVDTLEDLQNRLGIGV